jgi:chromosome partitioning protein
LVAKRTLAFHSYKGGTGKTTLVANIAANYAMRGMNVCLFDFDLYAPSLTTYFRKTPELYLNDFLAGEAEMSDILVDVSSELGLKGKVLLGLSSAKKEDVHEIEIHHDMKWQFKALRRFLAAKKELFQDFEMDYIILDTSPGIRYWSVNAIAAADLLFLIMKGHEMDIVGTKKMIEDTYDSLTKFGSRKFIILNKIPGASPLPKYQGEYNEWEKDIQQELGTQVLGSIPCFCDVQFNKHEFLSIITMADHPFSKYVITVANKINSIE